MALVGTVKWFNDKKGFGFIERPEGVATNHANDDIFVHHSAVSGTAITEGDKVEFELSESSKGLRALNVRRA